LRKQADITLGCRLKRAADVNDGRSTPSASTAHRNVDGVPIRRPLFQGARLRVGMAFSAVIVISDTDPFYLFDLDRLH
jgi:hypothetical protein